MRNSVMVSAFAAVVLVAGLSGCAGLTASTDEATAVVDKVAKVAPLPGGLPAEPTNAYTKLGPPSPHWVMYVGWDAFEISRYVILDADAAELKAHIST